MTTIPLSQLLAVLGGPKGLPFPTDGKSGKKPSVIATGFESREQLKPNRNHVGTAMYSTNTLGALVFMPVFINGYELPNAWISAVEGEKEVVQEDMIRVGTVIESVFRKPYDITIICTCMGADGQWPEEDINNLIDGWETDQVVTLQCAYTDRLLNAKDNFVITRIRLVEMQGMENVQAIEFDGISNTEFELELI